ncbi:hypothetical protein RO03_01535 [Fusobacterium nucleatum subsp. nucleatum]|jgi:hypothetical protein|uniref:Nitroreductase domain-containing protein n=1 Tax=Fusobacterium nucleatum subsp. nucleatum TaxID=76856 RepID=A0A101K658_FUSNC|nr:SagB/ThcOx family dehydrogenase [Fusobacterium nucleatum]KUL98244.1 hypothetical protein RO03_01535 [Fusobacterium nucleatum subsp. nucleatum]MBW9312307.1 SagB/ThcOx family dehydrogenase [Fusobacterium nucleatum]
MESIKNMSRSIIEDYTNLRVVWSPSVKWLVDNNGLKIEIFRYKGGEANLFPEFYYITQKGILFYQLIEKFPSFNKEILKKFILDLYQKRILVDSPLKIKELFYTQNNLFENTYPESIRYDSNELDKFKNKQLNRCYYHNHNIHLMCYGEKDFIDIKSRRSIRDFNINEKISFEIFSKTISIFKQLHTKHGIFYNYASAGGLYPIDIYIYVKQDKVMKINEGLYYYSPIDNSIYLINGNETISCNIHYYSNQKIYENSAYSIFFIYNAEVSMPKYEGIAYEYALIDTGIMVQTYCLVAESAGLGCCSIGDLNFEKIEHMFKLSKNQIHVHTLEVGLKKS